MFTPFYRSITIAIAAALLVTTGLITPVAAETTPQPATNREGAGAPSATLVTIEPGVVHWYRFKYAYDSSSNSDPSEAIILLKMNAAGCVGFYVETPGTLAAPAVDENGNKRAPIGRGSPLTKKVADFDPANATESAQNAEDTNENGQIDKDENPYYDKEHGIVENEQTLVWVGSARAKETFYVVVKNTSTAACSYKLNISGPTVSFPSSQ
jgi:hypothetical protein